MIISLNWLKDFVDIPADLDPRDLALRFTLTTAEVEGVERVGPNFTGLVAARIESIRGNPGEEKLKTVIVDAGAGKKCTSLTTAPDIKVGDVVIYAPPGAVIAGHEVGTTDPAGRPSEGMIVAGQSIGLMQVGANAMFLPPSFAPGQVIGPIARGPSAGSIGGSSAGGVGTTSAGGASGVLATNADNPFDDWVIEIDNKSITHRPDCWGHYGIAREVAAILGVPLKAYDVTDPTELTRPDLPAIPIEIDDPALCPRYSGLLMKGLKAQPAPLWMQVRLALCGQRPIDLLVDLTNYIMLELGQPMHAFDGAALPNIQVATAAPGERFTTLDGTTRAMPPNTLMIKCNRKSVAIAGIMGGAETEVSEKTDTVLLESANFDAATIRRAASVMGHRTEASARFEKSLDPANTVLAIGRFHNLAKQELPGLQLASTLSDCYPAPTKPQPIELDCDFTSRFIGKEVAPAEITKILTALEFKCEPMDDRDASRQHSCTAPIGGTTAGGTATGGTAVSAVSRGRAAASEGSHPPAKAGGSWDADRTTLHRGSKLLVTPPSYRATKDIEIEADLIEEIARFVGYNNIEPALPKVATRFFAKSPELVIEERTLQHLCVGGEFVEVHNYIWYDDDWLKTLGFDPGECLTLQNPIAEDCSRFRRTLMPGLIAMAERNRHHHNRFQIVEIGTVFEPGQAEVEQAQHRNMGLVVAQAGKKADAVVWDRLRGALDGWARQVLESQLAYKETKAGRPWEDADRVAEISVAGRVVGRATILPLACKQRIDERLKAWSIAMCELELTGLADLVGRHEKLSAVPRHPGVRLDFSFLTDGTARYNAIERRLAEFKHPLLRRLSFVDTYQGGSIPAGKRSLMVRADIGLDERTLSDEEIHEFQSAFRGFLTSAGMALRG
ncbi:MAG: phenylalanine--tRNA ligase subunit beta [Phycisphaerae bacterium]|nr:phenylalanine--tRNA ligase subunit beta [Phycisphaerae bacterium]